MGLKRPNMIAIQAHMCSSTQISVSCLIFQAKRRLRWGVTESHFNQSKQRRGRRRTWRRVQSATEDFKFQSLNSAAISLRLLISAEPERDRETLPSGPQLAATLRVIAQDARYRAIGMSTEAIARLQLLLQSPGCPDSKNSTPTTCSSGKGSSFWPLRYLIHLLWWIFQVKFVETKGFLCT